MNKNKNKKFDLYELDYNIVDCIIHSGESFEDILNMLQRFIAMRFQCECSFPLNIQNPRPVGDETDIKKGD